MPLLGDSDYDTRVDMDCCFSNSGDVYSVCQYLCVLDGHGLTGILECDGLLGSFAHYGSHIADSAGGFSSSSSPCDHHCDSATRLRPAYDTRPIRSDIYRVFFCGPRLAETTASHCVPPVLFVESNSPSCPTKHGGHWWHHEKGGARATAAH